jgi:hypothetical protein
MLRRKFIGVCALVLMVGSTVLPAHTTAQVSTCATKYSCNCVLYVRCKWVPSLPYGLNTLADKKAIVNSATPTVGSAAIMNVGAYGHVAYVTAVKKDTRGNVISITVDEANYKSCKIGQRTGSPASMKVIGYYRPGIRKP